LFPGARSAPADGYTLVFPERTDRRRLRRDTADCLGADAETIRRLHREYTRFHKKNGYERRFGERKTLNFDEAFVIFATLSVLDPRGPIVEIGTQHGRSTRRVLDMLGLLERRREVICFDIEDQVDSFSSEEATLRIEDLTGRFRETVLDQIAPGLVYLDAHPYHLTKEVITDVLDHADGCVLAIHDCGRALCNPNMELDKDDLNITSATGHWERHVLCEVFGVADPMTDEIDHQETRTHSLTIMQTTHGLGVIVPRRMTEGRP
jgi:hypothetical protein